MPTTDMSSEVSRRDLILASAAAGLAFATDSISASAVKTHAGRTFVLVHGAFRGGWCYQRVADILRRRGHRAFTPTLTGLGERSHLANAGVNCSTHIQDILNVIKWEQLNDIVLCGHSYGGMIIGAVADKIPDRVASLVYLDAIVPEDGKSTLDFLSAQDRAAFANLAADNGGVMVPPPPAAAANVNPADQAMVDALCTSHPFATFCERLELTGAYKAIPKKVFILATGWKGTHIRDVFARMNDEIRNDETWSTFEIASGHDVMLDAPERLAEILVGAM